MNIPPYVYSPLPAIPVHNRFGMWVGVNNDGNNNNMQNNNFNGNQNNGDGFYNQNGYQNNANNLDDMNNDYTG